MIYGFIVDEALQKWDDRTLLASSVDQGSGYASENVLEYFNQVGVIRDHRDSRFAYMGSGITMFGKLGFIIDKRPPNVDGVVESEPDADVADNETLDYDRVSTAEWQRIFNIIEDTLYYRSGIVTGTLVNSLNLRFSSGSSYSGYEVGTLHISSETSGDEKYIPEITATASNKSMIGANELSIPMWMQFSFKTTELGIITFKLWIHQDSFLREYPYSTICDVVLPMPVERLADPTLLGGAVESVIDTSSFVQEVYKDNLAAKEASGAAIYSTVYMPESINRMLPFGVIYKGTEPSDDLKKKAIRRKLIEEGLKVEPNITENTWYVIFPNLFVAAKFYLVPMFSNLFEKVSMYLENGIQKFTTIESVLQTLFPYSDITAMRGHLELVGHDATNLIIAAIPDPTNDSNKWLHDLLADYMAVDGTDRTFSYQGELTQRFSLLLAEGIEGARRDELPSGFTATPVECGIPTNSISRTFYMFEWNHTQIFIMPKNQFDLMMTTTNGE